jgi:CHAD domain-containing protein
MAYRYKIGEPVAKGIRRIACEQAERAEQRLLATDDAPTAIHEARKHLKRARALLRLVRPVLGDAAFHRENARFREIGLLLSGARDLDVLAQTVATLEAGSLRPGVGGALAAVSASIESARQDAEANGMSERREKACLMLRQAREELASLKIRKGGFELVALGLRRTYSSCRKKFQAAYALRSDANFHEWRKTVQHHWRQMILLSRAWPDAMLARATAAKELSEILGRDHDLALLKEYVETKPGAALSVRDRDQIRRLCCAQQERLRTRAHPRGARLLAEKTGAFCARIEGYWDQAVRIAAVEEKDDASQRRGVEADAGAKTRVRKQS